jgi:hypothetical protein
MASVRVQLQDVNNTFLADIGIQNVTRTLSIRYIYAIAGSILTRGFLQPFDT